MRVMKTLSGALAVAAILLLPGTRAAFADDYNKLTYFTFSGPVQVPGATLAAGTYMFKLADPESGRRAIQIWDKDGKKLYTTLLSMTNERMDIPKNPLVMFNEQPVGEAPAVRVWYYEGVRAGYEFIYPRNQAAKIAKASHTSVLALNTETTPTNTASASVGHINEQGQFTADSTTASSSSSSSVSSSSTNASTTTAPAARTTTAPPAQTASTTTSAPRSATTTTSTQTSTTTAAAPTPPLRQTTTAPPIAQTSTTPRTTTAGADDQSVRTQSTASNRQAESQIARNLPATASPLPLAELLSGLSLAGAFSVRQWRKHVTARP